MAKKTTVTTVEENVDDKGVDYDKMHKANMDEVLVDATKSPTDDKKPDEKPEDKKPDEEKVDVELEELDTEKLKNEAVAQAKKEITEALAGKTKEETEVKVDEYEQWAKKVFDETGKPPNWKQAAEFIKENAKRELREEQEAKVKEEEEQKTKVVEEEKKVTTDWNAFIDRELDDLYEENKLPRILNKDDETDPGVIARKALFKTMLDTNTRLQNEGKPVEYSIYKIFHKYYKPPNQQPAGADAPIAGGNTGGGAQAEEKVSYQELKQPWHSFLRNIVKPKT